MSRHTPGPWVAMRKKYSRGSEIKSSSGLIIADTWVFDVGSDVEANTRLIAAAPELLGALIGLISITNDSAGVAGYHLNGAIAEWDEFEEVAAAIEAITKATGENQC